MFADILDDDQIENIAMVPFSDLEAAEIIAAAEARIKEQGSEEHRIRAR